MLCNETRNSLWSIIGNSQCFRGKSFEKGKPSISSIYGSRLDKRPMDTFKKIHSDLMEYSHKFGENEWNLFELFGEILAGMDEKDFTDEPLNGKYLHAYYSQQHSLNHVMGVEEASEILGLSPGTIKNYCAEGKIIAKKIGKTWIIEKNQPNPKQREKENKDSNR